ncbi:MAG: hypothetical protein MUE30_18920 [Spirosomaceae bacterium]|jgi:hypothetical protein|nr:hypothetical protein [Spirosomataceae bacterium]
MKDFTKYLILSFLALILGLGYYAASTGVGLKNFTNAELRAMAAKEQQTDSLGRKRRHRVFGARSYFSAGSVRGGSRRFGK